MTLASGFFLAAVVAAFVFFMGLLAYAVLMAGEGADQAAAEHAAGVAERPAAETGTRRVPANRVGRLDEVA